MKLYFRKIFISSAVVLLAAGCSQAQDNNQPLPLQNQQPTSTSQTQTIRSAGKPDYKPGFIIVTQTISGSNTNEPYTQILNSATARDLLTVTHKVDFKNYGSMGDFVTGIDGVIPDSKHFWEFFINGKSSNIGASSYILKNGDKIEWKLDEISGSNK